MFGGAFVVDPYSLALTGFFLAAAYVTLLLSVDYIGDGDYYQGEYYVLLLTSLLGMIVMSVGAATSSRSSWRSRRSRSRRSSSRAGASTTRSRTKRRSSTT